MQFRKLTGMMLAAALFTTPFVIAQDAKDSMKAAGHETKEAAKDAGHGTKVGTEKAYHKTKHATKKAAKKTATGTRNVGRRMEDKQPVPNNPK